MREREWEREQDIVKSKEVCEDYEFKRVLNKMTIGMGIKKGRKKEENR